MSIMNFKVGDKVLVIRILDSPNIVGKTLGMIGEVYRIYPNTHLNIGVTFPNGDMYSYHNEELRHDVDIYALLNDYYNLA